MARKHPVLAGVDEHRLHRRLFLKGLAASARWRAWQVSRACFTNPLFAARRRRRRRMCSCCGCAARRASLKPGIRSPAGRAADLSAAFRTKIPGRAFFLADAAVRGIAHQLNIVRCMQTEAVRASAGHQPAAPGATRTRAGFTRPTLGGGLSRRWGNCDTPIPNFVLLDPNPEGNEFKEYKASDLGGWLGPEHAPVRLGGELHPTRRRAADALRRRPRRPRCVAPFLRRANTRTTGSSTGAAARTPPLRRSKGLMRQRRPFRRERSCPAKDRARYGPGTFGLHALMARNLVEHGAPFVMVANGMPWDNHVFQHEIHQMLVPELDRVLFHLITDLEERGLLDNTLVIAMGEFGRTPWLNAARGRDHYPNAWSMMMTGCGLKRGVVVGGDGRGWRRSRSESRSTNRICLPPSSPRSGIDPYAEYDLPGMPTFHRVEDHAEPIQELLRMKLEKPRDLSSRPACSASPPLPDGGDALRRLHGRADFTKCDPGQPATGRPPLPAQTHQLRLRLRAVPGRQDADFRRLRRQSDLARCRDPHRYPPRAGARVLVLATRAFGRRHARSPASRANIWPAAKNMSPRPRRSRPSRFSTPSPGELLHAFDHLPPVLSVAFSPDGQHLAAANMMGEVRVWEVVSGKLRGAIHHAGFHQLGHHQKPPLLRRHLRPRLCARWPEPALLRHGPDDRSDGWQRQDDLAALGLAQRRKTGPNPRWRTRLRPDGNARLVAGRQHFLMAGRQAQGTWNAALFSSADGKLAHSVDTKKRITHARFTADGKSVVISGATGEPPRKDGKWPAWGRFSVDRADA